MIVELIVGLIFGLLIFTPLGGGIVCAISYIFKGNYSDPYYNQKNKKDDKQKQKKTQIETQSPFN